MFALSLGKTGASARQCVSTGHPDGWEAILFQILTGMRVVEAASFVAAPSCGMQLAQLGAEVIRLDQIGGSPDRGRWPLNARGASLFWEGLNKGKKSIAIDLRKPEGRELARAIITAPGENAGLFVTNFPMRGFLAHDGLAALRPDLVTVRITGHGDGRSAVDYTINPMFGLPSMTGPEEMEDTPVNHVLPAWDLLTGMQAATALLAAERRRRETGNGQEVRIALADIAMTTLGHLGQIGEVHSTGEARPRYGNALFGAFGRDFITADDERIMLVGLTSGQWKALLSALELEAQIAALEARIGASFSTDEGLRFQHRDALFSIFEAAVAPLPLSALAQKLDKAGASWSRYDTLSNALAHNPELSVANPIFSMVTHPGGDTYLTPGHAAAFGGEERLPPVAAPVPGGDTEQVLAVLLGLSSTEIARLHDAQIVASAPHHPA